MDEIEKKANELKDRADILLPESSATLILDGLTLELEIPWCRIHFLTFECLKCHKLHSIDLRRLDFLETMNVENWHTSGLLRNSCGRFNIKIEGKILIKPR